MTHDRNLLFGALALQSGLITADQLAEACSTWSSHRDSSLPAILNERGWLLPEDQVHVDYLVERNLAKSGGDARASITELPKSVRGVLATIGEDALPTGVRETVVPAATGGDADLAQAGQRFTLTSFHAAGGIGEIWLARDADLQRDVAVKRLKSQQSASEVTKLRFLREARITGQLDHPGVVPIYEVCLNESTGQPYYAMRFLKGRTLTALVREYHARRQQHGSDLQSLLELVNAFCIVCNTVAYAHSKGIIHRDLKCDNVIVGDYGEVVVIDWGLAKEVGGYDLPRSEDAEGEDLSASHPLVTLAGYILGSPAYMSPEQAAGRVDLIGSSSDIYGLCAILYEILCCQPPFTGRNAHEVLKRVQHDPPIPPSEVAPGVPEALEKICLRGLSKAQEQRHPSAESLADDVRGWVSDLAERRQSEEERERFFALSLDLLAIIGADGRIRQTSPAWFRTLGYDCEQLIGKSLFDLVHGDDQALLRGYLQDAWNQPTSEALETRLTCSDASYRWISWNVTPIAKEQCQYIVGRDITELKRSQQLFEGVLQSAPDAMVLIDRTGAIVLVNRQTEQVFGYAQHEMLGQPIEMLIPQRFREQHPANVASFFAAASVRPMAAGLPLYGLHKDGQEFQADIALSPIHTEHGLLVAASVRRTSDHALPPGP